MMRMQQIISPRSVNFSLAIIVCLLLFITSFYWFCATNLSSNFLALNAYAPCQLVFVSKKCVTLGRKRVTICDD